MTKDEVKVMFAGLSRYYHPNLLPVIDADTINAWGELLCDLNGIKVLTITKAWVQTNKYPPTIADIREMIAKEMVQDKDTAPEAWKKLNQAVKLFGFYDQKGMAESLGNGALRHVAEQFGMRHWCERLEANDSTDSAQFRDAYNAEVKKETYRLQVAAPIRNLIDNGKLQIGHGK